MFNLALGLGRVIARRWSWNGHLLVTVGKKIFTFIAQVSLETELWVSMTVLLGILSWNCYSSVTLGSISSLWSLFRFPGKQSFEAFYWETEPWTNMKLLVGRWSWKSHSPVTLWKPLHVHCSGLGEAENQVDMTVLVARWSILLGERASSWYDSFSWKMVLKKLFPGDTGETSALYIHCSSLLGDRASSWYDSFSGKIVLKRPVLGDIGKALALHIHCPGLLKITIFLMVRWSWKGHLLVTLGKPLLICLGDWGSRASGHSCMRQRFKSMQYF